MNYLEGLDLAILNGPVNKTKNDWWDLSFIEACEENKRLYKLGKGRLSQPL